MKKLWNVFKSRHESPPEDNHEQCSLCWGFQEYDGQVRELYRDKQKDVNNHLTSHMRVQRFIRTYFTGMKLKNSLGKPSSVKLNVKKIKRAKTDL
ncbi:MAG TPA: hypothetical protein VFM59_01050 [Salinimicrobium sp.]|nr:hypothetical protein [Salinimicrobium sp.]